MRRILLTILILAAATCTLNAQFRSSRNDVSGNTGINSIAGPPGAETMNRNNVSDTSAVATDSLQGFSLKRLVRGYARKDTLTPAYHLLGSAVIPGLGQIYSKDWWKVPVIYAGIGAGVYGGITFNRKYQATGDPKYKTLRSASYIAAGAVYWAHLLDNVVCFKTDIPSPVPAKSTLYSALLPGLGQANNGDWWKIPIWYGGFIGCGYAYHMNDIQYKRFKYLYNMDKDRENTGYIGGITSSQSEWYRDLYRRYRDYSVIAFILVYALNIIDANVFAYMSDFEVSDNIAQLEVTPAIIEPLTPQFNYYTYNQTAASQPAFGMNLRFSF